METAYWRRRLQSGEQLSTEILVAAVQPTPMRIVGRSTGGLQLLCVSSENKLYLVMRIQERGWSVIGSPLSVQLGCMEDLYGVCFRSESIYIVLSSVCWLCWLILAVSAVLALLAVLAVSAVFGCVGCFCCFFGCVGCSYMTDGCGGGRAAWRTLEYKRIFWERPACGQKKRKWMTLRGPLTKDEKTSPAASWKPTAWT